MKRKWICALLVVAMVLSMIPGAALRTSAANYNFTSSDAFIEVLKTMEGFYKRATWDYKQYTVGYGTRCPDDMLDYYLNNDITEEEALALLAKELAYFENEMNKFAKKYSLDLTQNQFDALVSFSYNCGANWVNSVGGYFRSAVISGDMGTDLLFGMCLWSTSGGVYNLIGRRICEANMYINGVYKAYNTPNSIPEQYRHVFVDGNGAISRYKINGYDMNDPKAPVADFKDIPTGIDENGEPFVYEFAGWYTAKTGGQKVEVLDGSLERGATIYAQWRDPNTGLIVDVTDLPEPPAPEKPENPEEPVEPEFRTGTVTADDVNVRAGAGLSFDVVGKKNTGDRVNIYEIVEADNYEWGRMENNTWIAMTYVQLDEGTVEPEPPAPPAPTLVSLELVSGPIKTDYVQMREHLDVTGSLMVATYSDGSIKAMSIDRENLVGFNNEKLGTITVKARYENLTVSFQMNIIKATVTFKNYDGTVLSTGQYAFGEELPQPETPVKPDDEAGSYRFVGWDRDASICRGNAVYTAVFELIVEEPPTEPSEPTDPTDPSDPTDPEDPTDPSEPTDPEDPTDPSEPEDPKPTEPTIPEGLPRWGTVQGTTVHVRSGPGTQYEILSSKNTGDRIEILEVVYDGTTYTWGRFTEDGADRWICMDFVKLDEAGETPPEVEEPQGIPGDMDGNETVNEDDAIYLLRHVLFPDMYEIESDTDVNTDGNVNEDDAIYLLRHVLFPDMYPLYPNGN